MTKPEKETVAGGVPTTAKEQLVRRSYTCGTSQLRTTSPFFRSPESHRRSQDSVSLSLSVSVPKPYFALWDF